jgi:hypothetical protein
MEYNLAYKNLKLLNLVKREKSHTCHKLKLSRFGFIIENILFIDDIVESPTLGKLTWIILMINC